LPVSILKNPIQDLAAEVIMPVHEISCSVLESSFHTALELGGPIFSAHRSAGPAPLLPPSDSSSKHLSRNEVQGMMTKSAVYNREDMLPVSPTPTSEAQEPVISAAASTGQEDQQLPERLRAVVSQKKNRSGSYGC
jgi:hypothetical protein